MGYDMYRENVSDDDHTAAKNLNIWGMGRIHETMYELDMLSLVDRIWSAWPDISDYLSDDDVDAFYGVDGEVEWPRDSMQARYVAARAAVRDVETGGVIPAFKLVSNDGWLVTPSEIRATLAVWDSYTERPIEITDTGFLAWVEYLRACRNDGFRVY